MDSSVYILFGISADAPPHEILSKCKDYCNRWTLKSVQKKLETLMSPARASISAPIIFAEGDIYLKTAAAMLLDPGARQCYDAWLDVLQNPTSEKETLTRSRLLWFNNTSSTISFSESMIKRLNSGHSNTNPKKRKKREGSCGTHTQCRECRSEFDLNDRYLVLHCHCTTRVGHVECMEAFDARVKHKCPVCRQSLLKRSQISKYLFWNVRERYKFIA